MNKKQDLREKVKEIKQRQHNWFKQRAEIQQATPMKDSSPVSKQGSEEVPSKPKQATHTQSSVPEHHRSSQTKSKSLAQSLVSSNKSNAKFQNWLQVKQNQKESGWQDTEPESRGKGDAVYNSNKYSDNYYVDNSYRDHKGSGSVNVLKVQSSRSPEFATPEPSWNSDDETGEITAAQLLSAEDFDARADDIIARVKGDLVVNKTDYNKRPHTTSKSSVVKHQVTEEQGLSSHVCPTCEKLMMPPSSSPMLLIPCGHTLCSACSRTTKKCAMCGCVVQSSTPNIMLQQIITNFHTKQTHRQTSHQTVQKQVQENNYEEEYQNLLTRQEILQEESENISKNIKKITRKLDKDQQQVSSIQMKEAELESEINVLQRKLQGLTEHRMEYEKNCYTLEVEVKQEKNRLILVQDSLSSVEQQIEKVQLLVEDGY